MGIVLSNTRQWFDKVPLFMIPAPKRRHLAKLPKKSYKVAQGDLIGSEVEVNGRMRPGGTIYVDDKRLGIEAGHMGISIDSEPYRNFIKDQILLLQKNNHPNQAMQKRFNHQKKNDQAFKILTNNMNLQGEALEDLVDMFIVDKKHKKIDGKRTNVGLGGLIFADYLRWVHIKEDDNHFVIMAKLTQEHDAQGKVVLDNDNKPKPLNDVYMVKGDNILTMGRAGPNLDRVRQTQRREWSHLLSGKNLARSLGMSAVAYAAIGYIWRANIMRETSPLSASTDAVVENVANKMAELRGIRSQSIDTVEGTFENGDPKVMPIVKWSTGFSDLSGKIGGNESTWDSVVIKFQNKHPVKVDDDGNTLYVKVDREGNKTYWKKRTNGTESNCSEDEYNEGYKISDNSILGLGEALVGMISMGDRDKFGKQGQNMGIMPLNPPQGQFTHQLYGIDYGKSYESDNTIVKTLRDDFSFDNPGSGREKLVNYSIMYDNPLRSKMKGVYMLAVLRGRIDDDRKEEIAKQYEASGDLLFAQKLRDYPSSLEHELIEKLAPNDPQKAAAVKKALRKNGDLYLIAVEQMRYKELANAPNISSSAREKYLAFAQRLDTVYKRALENDHVVLHKFEKRLELNPEHIDLLEKFEKLTARKAYDGTPDGEVKLNYLRVENEDRTEWQIDLNEDGTFNLVCQEKNAENIKAARKKLQRLLDSPGISSDPALAPLIRSVVEGPALKIENITKDNLALMNQDITEQHVADIHGLKPLIVLQANPTVAPERAAQQPDRTSPNQPGVSRTAPLQFGQQLGEALNVSTKPTAASNSLDSSVSSLSTSMGSVSEVGNVDSNEPDMTGARERLQDELLRTVESIEVHHPATQASEPKAQQQQFQKIQQMLTAHFSSKEIQRTRNNELKISNTDQPDKQVTITYHGDKTSFKQKGGAHKEMAAAVDKLIKMDEYKQNHRCVVRAKSEAAAEKLLKNLHTSGFDINEISAIVIKDKSMKSSYVEEMLNRARDETSKSKHKRAH